MRLIYVAGPFRAKTPWLIEQNVRQAEEWALKVAEAGHVPVCPHKMYQHFHGINTDQFWIDATLALLQRCDAAVFIPRWGDSVGARGEHAEAVKLKLQTWIHGQSEMALEHWLKGL